MAELFRAETTLAYLAACVFYATLFDADPAAVDFDGGLPEDQVQAIQAAVREAVE